MYTVFAIQTNFDIMAKMMFVQNLSEAHFLPKFKFKSVNKLLEVAWFFFSRVGFTQIWYKKLSLVVGVLTFYLNQIEIK